LFLLFSHLDIDAKMVLFVILKASHKCKIYSFYCDVKSIMPCGGAHTKEMRGVILLCYLYVMLLPKKCAFFCVVFHLYGHFLPLLHMQLSLNEKLKGCE
jgi:hypothetical protein